MLLIRKGRGAVETLEKHRLHINGEEVQDRWPLERIDVDMVKGKEFERRQGLDEELERRNCEANHRSTRNVKCL